MTQPPGRITRSLERHDAEAAAASAEESDALHADHRRERVGPMPAPKTRDHASGSLGTGGTGSVGLTSVSSTGSSPLALRAKAAAR